MKPYFRIFLALNIIWFGYKAVRHEFEGYNLGFPFYHIQFVPFILLIIFTIAVLLLDTTYYKLDKNIFQYLVSFIGLTFIAVVTFKIIQRNSIDNSNTILKISNLPGATNVMTFEFKENKHFRLTKKYYNHGQTVFYGKYLKANDSLKIIETNYDGYTKKLPQIGLIRNDTVYWNKFDTMLVDKE
ncbi:MAG: hypothetical protein H0V14_00525 [Chitinophagaceae bacterium]|nr:hypothetical protein [Chitinophagaceae bacterium]